MAEPVGFEVAEQRRVEEQLGLPAAETRRSG